MFRAKKVQIVDKFFTFALLPYKWILYQKYHQVKLIFSQHTDFTECTEVAPRLLRGINTNCLR